MLDLSKSSTIPNFTKLGTKYSIWVQLLFFGSIINLSATNLYYNIKPKLFLLLIDFIKF